ncbi:Oligoxyloglucan reducing end-specific cellobiohydrolase [Pluteus cervinus]|uniref:Oligoxyloglucan reducing end-specific cellobiohydrolase n=1 Tax=Pluteus cervinus TaxID=181527 RepID=A0ACD3BB44_9AGAR|nr:Oligoxyloglucan reducing end-specific cellobiohydrolase [Pluteus cervinus]
MVQRHRTCSFLLLLFLPFLLLVAADGPDFTISSFNNLPARLFFFDDTDTVIYHDAQEGNVYVSQDEGKSWSLADGVPSGKAMMVIEHPFDNNYAFVLTNGKTHYRTDNRGKTWRSFDMPVEPSLVLRPLSFHADPKKYGYILYQGTSCDGAGWGAICHDETWYTKEAFGDDAKKLLSETSRCQFAHSSKDFKHDAHDDHIYCVAFDKTSTTGSHSIGSSRLFSSTDFFATDNKVEDLGIGKNAKGVIAFAIVSKFAVVAMKDMSPSNNGEMLLYVTVDTKQWAKAQFPHASSAQLRENAYTIVESTTHSLGVDVVLQDRSSIGTLFVSNSNGTYFVESLKDTNRNDFGFVDFEKIYGIDGIGLANVVSNAQEVEGRGAPKQIRTLITFDDGSSWGRLKPPTVDSEGKRIHCNPDDADKCSLHLYSVTSPHNFGRIFSSPAPGFVMAVGSIGESLRAYEECDTFLSIDAGNSWKMVRKDAHKYEFGDKGSILVIVNDEEGVDKVRYSLDLGKTWNHHDLGFKFRARALITLPDSTSQKFLLLASVARRDQKDGMGRVVVVALDFSSTRQRKCEEKDFERWYARPATSECLMGHKQWYRRRKTNSYCYVGEKFQDPVEHEEDCECTAEDYECDYNYIRRGSKCEPAGPEPVPPGVCADVNQEYEGSSGYRKIPGNTCTGGLALDKPVRKKCSQAQPKEGDVVHQTFEFQAGLVQHAYFKKSTTILARLTDYSVWQSSNEGYTWNQLFSDRRFLAFYHHKYSHDRAYLITDSNSFFYTVDGGQKWHERHAPTPPNSFGVQVLRFHPSSDLIIWTGNRDCSGSTATCHAEAQYSRDNGANWHMVDGYVRNCAWAKDAELDTDPNYIICESYRDKKGSQRLFQDDNPLELIGGTNFYAKKQKIFENVVGFAKFSEFLVVAQLLPREHSLDLQVSLDGSHFAAGRFPPSMHPETHAYTVLESSTKALFLHMTMSEPPAPYWGSILKSNSNGTYFGLSVNNVNRDDRGYVDFEKLIGLDGIALINVVSNPVDAAISGHKKLQTRITHNDGSTWKPLDPPKQDSLGRDYDCKDTKCALHIHGYTERLDPRATYSTPSIVGLVMAVGSVGDSLLPYTESDTFISRDAGFTWEEVHKDAHLWEFGDSGSILIMANDEEPIDHVLFSTDEGSNWREYQFTKEKIRVKSIVTVPSDTSRRFILIGFYPRSTNTVIVHIDFSALTSRKCNLDIHDPNTDDFELWSPSEERNERCLFGRQTLYHRRNRQANCVVGNQPKLEDKVVSNCPCAKVDFECEFNHVKDENDECVLVPGTTPLPPDDSCRNGEEYWYERTAYRQIPYSTCEGGVRLDHGKGHQCPGFKAHSGFFWFVIFTLPFAIVGLLAYSFWRRSGLARGTIRLPSEGPYGHDSGILATLASVPWFLVGIAGIAWEWVASRFDTYAMRSSRGYRNLPVDEDAQVLRFEDEE